MSDEEKKVPPDVAALIRTTADANEETAVQAGSVLEDMGPPRSEDLTELMALLAHPHPDCGYWAATLIGRLGPLGEAAVQSLARAVGAHPALSVRERAAWALGKIGPSAREATEALQAASLSESPRLARLAKESLARVRES